MFSRCRWRIDEPLRNFRRGQRAIIALSKPSVASLSDEIVNMISNRLRNHRPEIRQPFQSRQASQNVQRRRRPFVFVLTIDQHDRFQRLDVARLQGGEVKDAGRIVADDELHAGAAQIADAVEEDHRM